MRKLLQTLKACCVEFAAEVGALQVGLAIRGRGVEQKCFGRPSDRIQQCSEISQETGGLQLCVDSVTGAGVGELEIEKLAGGDTDAGAAQTDTGGCKAAQAGRQRCVYRK